MFRTEIERLKTPFSISHQDRLITLGSCFSDEIGKRLKSNKFETLTNPFGTIFDPLSLFELIDMALEPSTVLEDAMLHRDGLYYNYKLHSSFRSETREGLLETIQHQMSLTNQRLVDAKVLFLTFGTAWVYQTKDTQMLVANCHKQPQKKFRKYLLTVEEIMTSFMSIKESIQEINPDIQIVLTVSPVRHTRETLSLNATSKAVLRLACHYLSDMAEDVHYFPSYEILTDDLRDYRFYEKDLIHPNEQAIDYIWDIFINTFCSADTKKTLNEWARVKKALAHRPFNPEEKKHQDFLRQTLSRLENLKSRLNVEAEIKSIKSRLETHG
ncbi:GSCFA domain-containing protein [Roseivirga sp. E12]|uniref:GSCFA domain-containing protein n=1 Tax=Roseivirga sp. E12 TaxID=2819237 RepID=UPI001ABD0802|nr:GSCFA domain-containing protein [Roseivirga sp. E12]MBO3697860.1 GSCFA domain-containing protein [Roseivirga sp. E12]